MYFSCMENTAKDYKKLYEESLLTLSISEENLAKERQLIISKDEQIIQLSFELDKFRKFIFGRKNEKLSTQSSDISQLNLFDLGVPIEQQEALSQEVGAIAKKKTPKKRAKGTSRMTLPENLRREVIIIEPKEDVSDCVKIGEEITEVLDLIPAEFYVKRYVRPKYARPNGAGIVIGYLPERVIEKGIPSNRLIACLVVDKFVYGMPLHRSIDKCSRLGVNLAASTVSDWLLKAWIHITPLWELLKLVVLNQNYLQTDETPLKVQNKLSTGKKTMHKGYMWVYHAPVDNLVLFDYRKGRDQSGQRNAQGLSWHYPDRWLCSL